MPDANTNQIKVQIQIQIQMHILKQIQVQIKIKYKFTEMGHKSAVGELSSWFTGTMRDARRVEELATCQAALQVHEAPFEKHLLLYPLTLFVEPTFQIASSLLQPFMIEPWVEPV